MRRAWLVIAFLALGQAIWGLLFGQPALWAKALYVLAIILWGFSIQRELNTIRTEREARP